MFSQTYSQETGEKQLISVNDTTTADRLFKFADSLMTASKHDSSLVYFERASKIYETTKLWKSHFKCQFRIAAIYGRQRKFDEAFEKINYVIDKSKIMLGEENSALAYSYFLMGNTYMYNEKFDKSLEYFQKALLLQISLLGTESSDVADTYSNIGNIYFYQSNYDKAIEYWLIALDIRKEVDGEISKGISDSYNNIAYAYQIKSEYDLSLENYFKSIMIRKKIYGEKHLILSDSYINLGIVYLEQSEFDMALKYYTKALEIRKEVSGEMHPKVADCYNNIGTVYYARYEYELALEYLKKAFDIRIATLGEKHTKVAESYGNLGNLYADISEYDLALEHLIKSLPLFIEILGETSNEVAENYNNLGVNYRKSGKYDLAIDNFTKALNIYVVLFGEKHKRVSETYNNLATCYKYQQNAELALEYNLKALSIQKEILGDNNINAIISNNAIGEIYNSKNNYQLALDYYEKAIFSNLNDSLNKMVDISKFEDSKYISHIELLTSLSGEALVFEKLSIMDSTTQNQRIQYLQKSLQNYEICDNAIQIARRKISNKNDKIALGELASKIYQGAFNSCLQIANVTGQHSLYFDKAFYFSERNKAMILSESLAEANALKFSGLPDSLIQKEKLLKNGITHYSTKLNEKNDYKIEDLYNNKLFELNREYENLTLLFEEKFSEYYELKYKSKVPTSNNIMKKVDQNTAIISYFWGEKSINTILITSNQMKVNTTIIDSSFDNSINDLITALKAGEVYELSNVKNTLYKTLIEPISNDLETIQKLVIVPDGILNKIPFEILDLTDRKKSKSKEEENYLVNRFEISYSPSVSLFYNSKSEKNNNEEELNEEKSFIGFAPVFGKFEANGIIAQNTYRSLDTLTRSSLTDLRGKLLELPYSKIEIDEVQKLFGGEKKILINEQATENNFKEEINNNSYNIVHISTHGLANELKPELSCLTFSQPEDSLLQEDGFLFSGETYNLNMHETDLLVLSSCESGIGKIAKGEGMIALTRGFLYSGVQNIMYSLWKINDKFTSEFMILFYNKLINNKLSYSAALKETKQEMIKKGVFPGLWASFVIVEN
jgi:CHAT domain-containing protein/Tfp pilus assembly protein PilF